MKKLYIFFLCFFLVSCFQNNEAEKISVETKVETSVSENSTKIILGNSDKEVVESYYSGNSEQKEEIKNWLEDTENRKTSEQGDIIEFLDFCEKLKKEVTNNTELNDFLYKNLGEEDYSEIFNSKMKLSKIDDIEAKILAHVKNTDEAGQFYKMMFEDFFAKKTLDCGSYVK